MNTYELSKSERVNRIGIGAVLIFAGMLAPVAPLGWIAVLPLVGTLPIFAGIYGVDPVSGFVHQEIHQIYHALIQSRGHRPHHS